MIGRDQSFARPTLLDNRDQFLGNVNTETVLPPVFEPLLELECGVVVENVHVQLALSRKAGEGQVTTAQVAHDWIDGVIAIQEIELRVQRMAQEELDDDLSGAKLRRQLLQCLFVGVGRRSDGQLLPQLFRQLEPQAMSGAVVHAQRPIHQAEDFPKFLVGRPLHPNEHTAWAFVRFPLVNV